MTSPFIIAVAGMSDLLELAKFSMNYSSIKCKPEVCLIN